MRCSTTTRTRTTVTIAAGALLLAGCGSDDVSDAVGEITDAIGDEAEAMEDAADAPDDAEAEADEPDATEDDDAGDAPAEVTSVEGRSIDQTVHHGGLEYTVEQMTVVDLDAEASGDGEVDQRIQGLELTFDVNVLNPRSDTLTPSVQATMRWEEPGTDNTVEVNGRPEFRQVPGDSSSSGEIVVTLPPADLEVYDDATTRLVLGASGQSPAQVPIGSDAELIDRFPVQLAIVDETFDVNDVLVSLTAAEIRWDNPNGSHVEDGAALLELTYAMENQGSSQSCSTRGEGAWALTMPSGDSIVDLGVSERCVRGDETETDVLTGFQVDGEYSGDYTLRHERSEDQAEITFTLEEAAGSPAAERATR